MFLNKTINKEYFLIAGISIYAFFVNWVSGNIGILPIDSFAFLDTGYSILNGKLPIRDFWIFTGLLVDYMEAFFLLLFGNNWNSHLIHSSVMNIFVALVFYFFLKDFKLRKRYIIFYCISFSTLCYPVSGTPFAYIHSYIFSISSILFLILAIKNKSKILWFVFPFICAFSFLSMQTPSSYILLILFFTVIYYFLKFKDYINLKIFLIGCVTVLALFIIFLLLTKTSLLDFIYQYILFPLTIGEGRISGDDSAYVSLAQQANFETLFGDFKFIHFLFIPLIFITLKHFKQNSFIMNLLNVILILSIISFIFNQLVTANQIYIFSLIPIIAAVLHLNVAKFNYNSKFLVVVILISLVATVKFHLRYNVDRKFHELENVDKSKALNASIIHPSLNNLKWINKYDEPLNEIKLLKNAIQVIESDSREKSLITHYQFISTILNKNLNILNRWYLWDNNTHPTENHKYFHIYKSLINRNIQNNNIKVIYLLGLENEILFENVKNYFTDLCFESTNLVEKRFSVHEIVNCKKK